MIKSLVESYCWGLDLFKRKKKNFVYSPGILPTITKGLVERRGNGIQLNIIIIFQCFISRMLSTRWIGVAISLISFLKRDVLVLKSLLNSGVAVSN